MNNIKVCIKGKNINNYIKWLIKQKIPIVKLDIINYKELHIIIDNKYYPKLKKYSKTYQVYIIEKYGYLNIINKIKNNYIKITSLIIAIFFLYFLTNIIFTIDIISNDREMTNLISKELEKNNIKKYKFKKSYKELENIKSKILSDNKEVLEWLEIESSGTKYIVKYVERKIEYKENSYNYQSITARKDAVITDIRAYTGERIKLPGDYIKKGDIAISGILEKTDGTKLYSKASGYVLGEVWYKVDIEYPYTYYEELVTGRHKLVPTLKILNHELAIFPYKKYKKFTTKEKIILKDIFNIFKLTLDEEYEAKIIEEIYTEDEVIDKSINIAKEKLLKSNNKIKNINNEIVLNKENKNTKIKLTIFFSVIEDITKVIEVKKEEIIDNY